MQLLSFDIFRTLGLPNTRYLKPETAYASKAELEQADWVLFPEYWQLNALIYGMQCRVFPSQASYLIGHNKIEMTRAFLAAAPAHVPYTVIQPNGEEQRKALWQSMERPFVAKLSKASMGQGVWLIETREDWQAYCERADVLYVQEYLPIDRDLRVVVVGDQVLSAYWRVQADSGFYNNVSRGGRVEYANVPQDVVDLVLQVCRHLGIDHAGFDVAVVDGHPYLIEFNRLFGNSGLGADNHRYCELLLGYLRRGLPKPRSPELGKDRRRLVRAA